MEQSQNKARTLFKLFTSMLYISTFTFGGGFVIVNFMKRKFVQQLHWIDEKEMLDFTAMAQASPGAIAVNAAILVGWKIGGFAGMIAAVIGTIIPPMIILSVISLFYSAFIANPYVAMALKGMQAAVAAIILDVALDLGNNVRKEKSVVSLLILGAAFVAAFVFDVNVIYIILAAALLGVLKLLYRRKGVGA